MVDKKSPASGWPIIQGDYHTGDANSPVAVITMGSHLDEAGICAAGAALAGSCKTENLGIEKVVANIISNPNIRFVLLNFIFALICCFWNIFNICNCTFSIYYKYRTR